MLFAMIVAWPVMAIGAAAIAGAKGRSAGGYFLLALLLPLVGLLIAMGMPSLMYIDQNGAQRRMKIVRETDSWTPFERRVRTVTIYGMVIAMIAAAIIITTQHAPAQTIDPYAKAYADQTKAKFEARKTSLLNGIKLIYYAFSCKANGPAYLGDATLVSSGLSQMLFTHQELSTFVFGKQFWDDKRTAAENGISTAKLQGCSYWQDHPEAVVEFRDMQKAAFNSLH